MIADVRIIGDRVTYRCETCRRLEPLPSSVGRKITELVHLAMSGMKCHAAEAVHEFRFPSLPPELESQARNLPGYGPVLVCRRCRALDLSKFSALVFASRLRASVQ